MARPRFIIGVDLGTTNTAVAYVDTRSAEQRAEVFELPQLVAPGAVDRRTQLPSFVYLAGEHDLPPVRQLRLEPEPIACGHGGKSVSSAHAYFSASTMPGAR